MFNNVSLKEGIIPVQCEQVFKYSKIAKDQKQLNLVNFYNHQMLRENCRKTDILLIRRKSHVE